MIKTTEQFKQNQRHTSPLNIDFNICQYLSIQCPSRATILYQLFKHAAKPTSERSVGH